MFRRAMLRPWAVLLLGILAACGSQPAPAGPAPTAGAPPTGAPTAGAPPTRTPAALATAASSRTAAVSVAPSAAATADAAQAGSTASIPDSLTPEGYHVLGRPDAPVTLVMYSDFL